MKWSIACLFAAFVAVSAHAADVPELTPEQKAVQARDMALRAPQEHAFAQLLLDHAGETLKCPGGDVLAADLASEAIGRKGVLEYLRRESAENILVARIHKQNDGLISGLANILGDVITLGLLHNHTQYQLKAGEMLLIADFDRGTMKLNTLDCFTRK